MRPPRPRAATPEKRPAPKAPHPRHGSVEPGDEVYVQHPQHGPMALKVLACGRDGFRGECNAGQRHAMSYDAMLGHKKRVKLDLKVLDQGQEGAIVQDGRGQRRYVAGDLGAMGGGASPIPTTAKDAEPVQRDPLLDNLDTLAKALDSGRAIFLKAGPVKNAPGLALRDITDRLGHQTKRWVRTAPELTQKRERGMGGGSAAAPPSMKHGDEVMFRHGDVRHRGTIVGAGADGVTVRDGDGRHHQVRHHAIEGRAHEVAPQKPDYAKRARDQDEKSYFKQHVDSWPDPDHLPEDHGRYFNDHEDAETIPLDKIAVAKPEGDKGAKNAPKAMVAAYHGAMGKRDPVQVERQPDGTYRVVDGNGTVAGVKAHGWKHIPAVVTNKTEAAEQIAHSLTTHEDAALPKAAAQPVNTEDELYQRATAALDELKTWLDKGKGVSSQMGHRHMTKSPDDVTPEEWANDEGMLFIAPLKGRARAAEKVQAEYGGNWNELRDVVRCSIALPTMDEVKATMERLRASGMTLAQQPKNRFAKPVEVGYRDLLLNVRLPSGLIAEVQLHAKPMLAAKNEGHHWYEVQRSIDAKLAIEKRPPTDEERAKVMEAVEKQKAIYNKAWAKAAGQKGEPMTKALRIPRRPAGAKKVGGSMGGKHVFIEHEGNHYRAAADWPAVTDILRDGKWQPYEGEDRVKPWTFGDRVDDPLGKGGPGQGDDAPQDQEQGEVPQAPNQQEAAAPEPEKKPMVKALLAGVFFWRR